MAMHEMEHTCAEEGNKNKRVLKGEALALLREQGDALAPLALTHCVSLGVTSAKDKSVCFGFRQCNAGTLFH